MDQQAENREGKDGLLIFLLYFPQPGPPWGCCDRWWRSITSERMNTVRLRIKEVMHLVRGGS